ncbi:MAG TPA: Crp/Fnr family transcriptional regulator [Candidatus Binatia bacterium]
MIHLESKALKQLKNFNRLSSSQLDKLAQNLTVRVFKKDETIFDQDERARLLYLVISGVLRVSYNGHDRQTIVSLLPRGEFFGVDSLVPDSRHPFRCDAFETSTIGSIKPRVFVETLLGTAYEDFLPGFVASLNLTRRAYIHCIRGIGLDVRRRIALELSNLADRFGSNDSRGILISLAISHETLAGIVGASRQQVTEYLNEFDREKIILREGRRIIVNLKNLRKVIENRP